MEEGREWVCRWSKHVATSHSSGAQSMRGRGKPFGADGQTGYKTKYSPALMSQSCPKANLKVSEDSSRWGEKSQVFGIYSSVDLGWHPGSAFLWLCSFG